MGVHWKIGFWWGVKKKATFFLGGPSQFADLRGGSAKKRGWVFLRGIDTPKHTMLHFSYLYWSCLTHFQPRDNRDKHNIEKTLLWELFWWRMPMP